MKRRPSALDMIIVSAIVWSLPMIAWLNAATGDCLNADCPTEFDRAARIAGAAALSLLLQFVAAVWYVRARNRG